MPPSSNFIIFAELRIPCDAVYIPTPETCLRYDFSRRSSKSEVGSPKGEEVNIAGR
jgi:hypothetical protein